MFTAKLSRPGGTTVEIAPVVETVQFDSAAVGGFGSCSFAVPGLVRGHVAHLTVVQIFYGTVLLWEGRIEDITYQIATDQQQTQVQAFGWRRLLDFTSIRRVWSKRDIGWQEWPGGIGAVIPAIVKNDVAAQTGTYDPTDLTKVGFRFAGNNVSLAFANGNAVYYKPPIGVAIVRLLADATLSGTNTGAGKMVLEIGDSLDGISFTGFGSIKVSATVNQALRTSAVGLIVWFYNEGAGAVTPTAADLGSLSNIRLLGTSLTEDVSGGFFGGTILNDLIALIPGLTAGVIEAGNDFTVQSIERSVRDTATNIVNEIASYYSREWAIWEAGRVDWKTPNLDEPQYIVTLSDCASLEITASVDTLTRTSYVLYTDASSGLDAEQSGASTSQKNPFVRTGTAKDDLQQPGIPMTSNTATQLAAVTAAANGSYPPVTGRIVLPARQLIANAHGPAVPAFQIRAGCNIYVPDLPRDQLLIGGRDGQTLFHVATCEVDMVANTVTLELEGQGRQMDVILARLAAVTRTITG